MPEQPPARLFCKRSKRRSLNAANLSQSQRRRATYLVNHFRMVNAYILPLVFLLTNSRLLAESSIRDPIAD